MEAQAIRLLVRDELNDDDVRVLRPPRPEGRHL
jgi:hypothetical protein